MQALLLLTFSAAGFADFAAKNWAAPLAVKFLPEMLSAVIVVWSLLEATRRGVVISARYWAAFGFLVAIIVCGIVSNDVGPGPTLAAMRYYLRPIPLFLLPAIFQFTDKQLDRQLKFVLAIGLIQVPIAIYQRWVIWAAERFSGDDVRGTLGESGLLSIILICMVLVLVGFLLKKLISWRLLVVLFFPLLLPTTINETKATFLLLPLGLLSTLVAAAPRGRRVSVFVGGVALLVSFAFLFIPIYNLMNADAPSHHEHDVLGFFTDQQKFEGYLEGKREVRIGENLQASRMDEIRVPLEYLSRDPVHLAFGLGLGNVSHSQIGENYTGKYFDVLGNFAQTSFAVFVLEMGILGVVFVFALYAMIGLDALAVAKADPGPRGAIAAGWIGVIAIMIVSTFYITMQTYSGISYLFWYFSGVVAARRAELALASQTSSPRASLTRAAR